MGGASVGQHFPGRYRQTPSHISLARMCHMTIAAKDTGNIRDFFFVSLISLDIVFLLPLSHSFRL